MSSNFGIVCGVVKRDSSKSLPAETFVFGSFSCHLTKNLARSIEVDISLLISPLKAPKIPISCSLDDSLEMSISSVIKILAWSQVKDSILPSPISGPTILINIVSRWHIYFFENT